jgi:alkylation response protein AidB-like acyl-CoA dehydrogenase
MIDQVNSRELFVAACGGRYQPRRSWFDRLDTVVDEHLTAAGADHDGRAAVSRQALDALRDIGAFGVQISIEAGGLGFDDAAACLVVERVAQACAQWRFFK